MDDIQEFRMEISGKKKLEQVRETGATYLATACSNCKRQLTQLMEHHNEEIDVGGQVALGQAVFFRLVQPPSVQSVGVWCRRPWEAEAVWIVQSHPVRHPGELRGPHL